MAKNVLDGEYVGELTPSEVVEQFLYRIMIHETYAGLVLEDPPRYIGFGSYGFHMWAINGYEHAIQYIQENNPVEYIVETKCDLNEALHTISRAIVDMFRKK